MLKKYSKRNNYPSKKLKLNQPFESSSLVYILWYFDQAALFTQNQNKQTFIRTEESAQIGFSGLLGLKSLI